MTWCVSSPHRMPCVGISSAALRKCHRLAGSLDTRNIFLTVVGAKLKVRVAARPVLGRALSSALRGRLLLMALYAPFL